jgi:hypothetical protein
VNRRQPADEPKQTPAAKKLPCQRCKDAGRMRARFLYTCRSCGILVCEHYCGAKFGAIATCSSCFRKPQDPRPA